MNRLPDQDPRAPKGAQELLVRWAVHRTNYRGQIWAHPPVRGLASSHNPPSRVHVVSVIMHER